MRVKLIFTFVFCCLLLSCKFDHEGQVGLQKPLPKTVDFNFHIKPILSDRCFKCHGPDQNTREADLRLDDATSALETALGEGGYAWVPGSKRKSIAYQRINSHDPERIMPPPEAELTLSNYDIALIGKWIEQGAEYKKHWSFIPPAKSHLPVVANTEWPKNEIDHFVMAKLEDLDKVPNHPAADHLLLRRLYLDLTGLPPDPASIDAFLSSSAPNKIERIIDELLASPHYGEYRALEWMDVARYADSHGYSQDGSRTMYPWRDWVINAFHENIPFDQFILWQMAGDLLPNSTKEMKLATAFLRNHRINAEGGIIPEEYRVEYVSDRTHTTATAFLGLTIECARCHDHKYDPISQKEYYQFFSFFNQTNEEGQGTPDGNTGPEVYLADDEIEARIEFIDQQISAFEKEQESVTKKVDTEDLSFKLDVLETDLERDLVGHLDFEQDLTTRGAKEYLKDLVVGRLWPIKGAPELSLHEQRKSLKAGAYDGVTIPSKWIDFRRDQAFSFSFWLEAHPETNFMEILHRLGSKYRGQKGYDLALRDGHIHMRLAHSLPANLIEVKIATPLPQNKWSHIAATYDGSGKASGVRLYLNGTKIATEILFDQLERKITHNGDLTIGGSIHLDENVDNGHFFMDELKIYRKELTEVEVLLLYDEHASPAEEQLRQHFVVRYEPQHNKIVDSLDHYRQLRNDLENQFLGVMVMQDVPQPRPTFVLNRGQYDAPMKEVSMGTPTAIKRLDPELPSNRLGLAQWLIDSEHPLTARVTVNRLWQQFFGRGIVGTVEDFGSQGALPSHPQLLDWLSVYFTESGWNLKALIKKIMMSATYQQSSLVPLEARQHDPDNSWLARGPSYRLSAELLRDNVLAASGLLHDSIGGPSVKPYQPEGLWDEKTSFTKVLAKYEQGHGADLYRRSLYTFWRRTSHHPVMSIFDAPTRDNCTVRRQMSNTPLQALAMMNETQFVEAARVLAADVLRIEKDRERQIKLAHQRLSASLPDAESLAILIALFEDEKQHFDRYPKKAKALLSIGEYPTAIQIDEAEHAAMTVVCNTIMNFDEMVTKR
ncbi:MAG: DUF1553 domain-containing protein [Saprospiraceae bacterium]|nr:DUF1553 domain-containing protein [Saprospiraceae bacterium]